MIMEPRDTAGPGTRTAPVSPMLNILSIVLWVIGSVGIAVGIFAFLSARSAGEEIGGTTGAAVGKAVGSFEGIILGLSEGGSAGTKEGLSADDTTVMLQEIRNTGRLQVLVADINLDIFHMIGKDGESKSGAEMDVGTTTPIKSRNICNMFKFVRSLL